MATEACTRDTYFDEINKIYKSLTDDMAPAVRWKKAYKRMPKETVALSPTEHKNEFAKIYADAIDQMMATCGSFLVLPKNFTEEWRAFEKKESVK